MKQEILNAVASCNFYDWIACNYYRLSKEELVTILKEYVYQLERFNPIVTSGLTAIDEVYEGIDDYLEVGE